MDRKIQIEIHTRENTKLSSKKRPDLDGKVVAGYTRVIVHPLTGATQIKNFKYLILASQYIAETFGDIRDDKFEIISNYKRYGERGYQWESKDKISKKYI